MKTCFLPACRSFRGLVKAMGIIAAARSQIMLEIMAD